jgi:hypothetical protein
MTRDRNDGHAMQVEAPGAARVPRDFSRAGAPEAVEDPSHCPDSKDNRRQLPVP